MNMETTNFSFDIENASLKGMSALIVVHDNHQEGNVFPLGAAYIASMLRDQGVNVQVYCMDVFHYTNEDLVEVINNNNFDFIMLGFMVPRFKRTVRALCETIDKHKNKNTWFVLGGFGPSAIPEYTIEKTGADLICIGESEHTIVEVAYCKLHSTDNTISGSELQKVKGIVYKDNEGNFITTEKRPKNKKLDDLPFPAWDLFPMDIYTTNLKFFDSEEGERIFPIVSTRGCTDKCSFCFRLETGIRSRSPESILSEMKALKQKYNVNYFYFVDELAIISKKQILKLTSAIQEELSSIHYRMDCRVTLFDDEIAAALKASGCSFLNIGFESSSQDVLNQMNKRATVEQNLSAVEMAQKHGIGVGLNFIWGMPGDTKETMINNAEFIKKYTQYEQIRTIRPVSPYPGSPLYYLAISQGALEGAEDFFEKFKNSDRYMVNFTEMDYSEIYESLLEVNRDLIFDFFKNTDGDLEKAELMVTELSELYNNEDYVYTGPRQYNNSSSSK